MAACRQAHNSLHVREKQLCMHMAQDASSAKSAAHGIAWSHDAAFLMAISALLSCMLFSLTVP